MRIPLRMPAVVVPAMLLGLAGVVVAGDDAPPEPARIVERMEQAMRGDASYAEMTMRIVRPRYEREISLRAWMLGRTHALIGVMAPARDQGTAFLLRDRSLWTFDPRIDRTTRLPSSMLAQPWMGSDFTNDDLVRDSDSVDDYTHELLRTEPIDGRQSHVLRMVPKPDRPIVWGHVLMWICATDYLQLRVEFFDQRSQLVNTMVLDEITRFGDREVPARITVTPYGRENEQTVLRYHQLDFTVELDESFFTQRTMRRLP